MGNPQLSAGSLFANRFEIERLAGSGGMGTVYRARDRYSGNLVALKLLHGSSDRAEEGERFGREAQLLSELRHPGIVSHIAHGQTPSGQRFLAMEWLDGEDLGQRLLRGPLLVSDCVRFLERVAGALAVAHQRGIIHRDLKPTNLFLPHNDLTQIKILDFGIARRITSAHGLTQTGTIVGTPEYMAPEQARGVRELTAAADLFSLGCVLYECLTGQPPFVAENIAALLVRILFEEPAPVEQRRTGVPPQVVALLGQLLGKDPLQRPRDATALLCELAVLGEVPEAGLAETMASSKAPAAGFAENEQSLYSIVLAAPREAAVSGDRTLQPGDLLEHAERQVLLQALASMGVLANFLASGALVVTVPATGSATDQVTRAGRAALLIKERWSAAVVSMATGRGALREQGAFGEVVDAAAHALKAGSQPAAGSAVEGVFIDSLSAQLLEGRFAQLPRPGGALLVAEEREIDASRLLLGKPTPCVGRDVELGTLESQLTSCSEESEARVTLITAPPGSGKSRLRHEFLRRVGQRAEAPTVLWGRGELTSAGAPYGILSQTLRRLGGPGGGERSGEPPTQFWHRLLRHVPAAEQERVAMFLGELSGIPRDPGGNVMLLAAREDPRIMRDRVRRAFVDWLAAECQAAPVVLVLDDLQWSDELSVAILDDALRELRAAPLFILALARPEVWESFPTLWPSHQLQEIKLKGLSKKACERLAQQVLGKPLLPELVGRLVAQSAGNALFLEELIRAISEGREDEQPATVLAMLQARLGRFATGPRRAVRAAAVFGQTFWRGGVAALLELPGNSPEVEHWLSALKDAEVIEPRRDSGLPEEQEFSFRHALVRDAAYSLLTPSDLATGHLLAAGFLESAGERDPAVIAHHYELGGERPRAALLYGHAVERALDRFANESALRWIERSLACDAAGELLVTLRAAESSACFMLGRFERGFPVAMAVLPLLRAGSLAWARAIFVASIGSVFGPPDWQQQFPAIAAQILAVTPEPEAEAVYVEAVSHTVASLALVLPAAQLREPLLHLQAVCERAAVRSPTLKRHFYSGAGRCLRTSSPTPWQQAHAATETARLCTQAGDLRTLYITAIIETVWADLGDSDKTLALLAAHEHQDEQQAELTARMLSRVLIASILARQESPAAHEQAAQFAREALSTMGTFAITAILSHGALARVLLRQGKAGAAEAEVRIACAANDAIPGLDVTVYATLIHALLMQGQNAEAIAAAEWGLGIIQRLGCAGWAEVELRLAVSECFHAAGDLVRAHVELGETLRQIGRRADDITDSFWRTSYLTRNPYCVRAQQLGQEWGI